MVKFISITVVMLLVAVVSMRAITLWTSAVATADETSQVAQKAVSEADAKAAEAASPKTDPLVKQPIDFPHARHAAAESAGGMGINCLYCHSYARRSAVAGIPTLAKCMGCHKHVAKDKERITALTEYWKSDKPVPWKKVHDLPDFVYFTHERHVQRFVFQQGQPVQQVCGYCHGDVKTMSVAERKKPLTMGWCLSCHKQFQEDPPGTPEPASEWVIPATDKSLLSKLAVQGPVSLRKAPGDCWECHK